MSLGTAIFLSVLIIGLVLLYRATSEQWNWKRGLKRIALLIVGLVAILVCFYLINEWNSNRAKKQEAYMGIRLANTKDEVLFLKGKPSKDSEKDFWTYEIPNSYSSGNDGALIAVQFKNGKVQVIDVLPNGDSGRWTYNLNQILIGDSSEKVIKKFGKNYKISESDDGLKRIYSFPKYQVFFELSLNKVQSLGVYDPVARGDAVRYLKEKNKDSTQREADKDPLGLFASDNPALRACLSQVDSKDPLGLFDEDKRKEKRRKECFQQHPNH